MNTRGIIILPVSILYGLITFLRNVLFDIGIFPEKKHAVTVVSVGNLSVGGTGKTPHIEFLVRLLKNNYKTATLSRGYGRKTKGFALADDSSTTSTIGDEPMQYYNKFDDILVAVDGRRNRGVTKLLESHNELKVILLDDAFQHRWIKPDLSILLTDYHNLYHQDYMMPSGRLREFRSGVRRADIIIVTKTPIVLSPITRRRISDEMNIKPYQKLLFSKIIYNGFYHWSDAKKLKNEPHVSTMVLFTGIANSYPLQDYLTKYCNELVVLSFPDHHNFNEKDIQLILKTYNDQFTKNKCMITTEKDVQRLNICSQKDLLKEISLYYVPIHIVFHNEDEQELQNSIGNLLR